MPNIVKGDGTVEPFRIEKLIMSMQHSGAEPELAEHVARRVGRKVKEGMSTTEIYRKAYALLRKEERVSAARYSMRRAILDLGPTGFPFEDFVAELMRARGFTTDTRVMVSGKCATHEVDVMMEKDNRVIGAELKFHNRSGFKTDLKTALYVAARFQDIEAGSIARHEEKHIHEGWLITNTKFTSNAISYSECTGIRLLGWSYPHEGNLADIIRETGVYPITVLTSLSSTEKKKLLETGITLCRTLIEDPASLRVAGISSSKHSALIAESEALCGKS